MKIGEKNRENRERKKNSWRKNIKQEIYLKDERSFVGLSLLPHCPAAFCG